MSEQSPSPEVPREHPFPDLVEEAGGDEGLLDRLTALRLAERRLEDDPNDEVVRTLVDTMQVNVEEYKARQRFGLH